jgi:hypothetical protein
VTLAGRKRDAYARWVLPLVAGLVAVAVAWWSFCRLAAWQRVQLADALAREAAVADPSRGVAIVRQLAGLGHSSSGALVRLASLVDSATAQAARREVDDRLESLRLAFAARHDRSSRSVLGTELTALAESVDEFAPTGDAVARRWVSRASLAILRLSRELPDNAALAVARHCDRALAAASRPVHAEMERPGDSLNLVRDQPSLFNLPIEASPDLARDTTEAPQLGSPGAGAPDELAADASRPRSGEISSPPQLRGETSEIAISPPVEADPAAPSALAARPLPSDQAADLETVIEVPTPREMQRLLARLRQLPDRQLTEVAEQQSLFSSQAARQVLAERKGRPSAPAAEAGSKHVVDHGGPTTPPSRGPDLLGELAQLPPSEAREAIRRLVGDEDPEVRLEALRILATTGDPQAQELLRERIVADPDPRVAELASKILRQKR